MKTLLKLGLTAASALALTSAANAAVIVTDGAGNPVNTSNSFAGATLNAGGALNFDENDLENGDAINETLTFTIGAGVTDAKLTFGVLPPIGRENGAEAGIAGLQAMISVDGSMVAQLDLTSAQGLQDLSASLFNLSGLMGGELVEIMLTGTVFETEGDDAEYSVNVIGIGEAVPVPAAGLLFAGAALAGAAARRKARA